jgi:hypothetical protein
MKMFGLLLKSLKKITVLNKENKNGIPHIRSFGCSSSVYSWLYGTKTSRFILRIIMSGIKGKSGVGKKSLETRLKMSVSKKLLFITHPELRNKYRNSKLGDKNPMFGKTL